MRCLIDTGTGFFQVANPQPTELTNCVYLIAQPTEIPTAFMNLTPDDGLKVGGLLATVLVVGFTFRAIARVLSTENNGNENHE